MKVPFLQSDYLPEHQTEDSAGVDLYNAAATSITLKPLQRYLFPTGLSVAVPKNHTWLICPRSGLANKKGLTVLNAPGVIDSDYRNEVGVILVNLSNEPVTIIPGERIAQAVLVPYKRVKPIVVDSLDETSRQGGFGSTG